MRGDGEMVEHEGGSPISDDAQTQSYDSLSRRPRAGSASHSSRCWSFFRFPMNSHSSLGIAAAVGGGLFLAYCVYFDRKRRSDPLFKQKLKARRAQAKKDAESKRSVRGLPDLNDLEAVQKFFVQELQFGEELLAMGEIESGVEHLSNAIAVCGQPQQLLQILQQTLPAPVFQMILTRLPVISQQMNENGPIRVASQELVDDDVE